MGHHQNGLRQPQAWTGDFYLDLTHRTGTTRWLVPAGTQTVHLRSIATSRGHDLRRLGTAICGLRLDGYAITLDDPRLLSGFHDVEHEGGRRWRWTDAEAVINVATPVDVWLELDLFERSAAAAAA